MDQSNMLTRFFGLILALIGSLIGFACFFMPWVKAKMLVKNLYYSGLALSHESAILWLVPILAILIGVFAILSILGKLGSIRIILILLSGFGIIFTILVFSSIGDELSRGIKKIVAYNYWFGLWGVLAGFALALFGGIMMRRNSA